MKTSRDIIDRFNELLETRLNGNINVYKKAILKMGKIELVKFIIYARSWHEAGGFDHYGQFQDNIIEILLENQLN